MKDFLWEDRPVFQRDPREGETMEVGGETFKAQAVILCFVQELEKWVIVSKKYWQLTVKHKQVVETDRKDKEKILGTSWGRTKSRLPTRAKWRGSMSLEIVEADFQVKTDRFAVHGSAIFR